MRISRRGLVLGYLATCDRWAELCKSVEMPTQHCAWGQWNSDSRKKRGRYKVLPVSEAENSYGDVPAECGLRWITGKLCGRPYINWMFQKFIDITSSVPRFILVMFL